MAWMDGVNRVRGTSAWKDTRVGYLTGCQGGHVCVEGDAEVSWGGCEAEGRAGLAIRRGWWVDEHTFNETSW